MQSLNNCDFRYFWACNIPLERSGKYFSNGISHAPRHLNLQLQNEKYFFVVGMWLQIMVVKKTAMEKQLRFFFAMFSTSEYQTKKMWKVVKMWKTSSWLEQYTHPRPKHIRVWLNVCSICTSWFNAEILETTSHHPNSSDLKLRRFWKMDCKSCLPKVDNILSQIVKAYYTPNSLVSHLWPPKCSWYYGVL